MQSKPDSFMFTTHFSVYFLARTAFLTRRARAAARERAKAAQTQASRNAAAVQPALEKKIKKQTASVEAEGRDNRSLSRNEEIIELHKQGKTVMEISKLLGMGQGEVRLIINLYG